MQKLGWHTLWIVNAFDSINKYTRYTSKPLVSLYLKYYTNDSLHAKPLKQIKKKPRKKQQQKN